MGFSLDSRSRIVLFIIFTLSIYQFTLIKSHSLYSFDGYPLTWLIYGKIHGDIFVDGGHGIDATPYTENFVIPAGDNITFAGLFIGVWGGTEYQTGWIETFINGSSMNHQNIKGTNEDNLNILGAAHGVYLIYYNITSHVEPNSFVVVMVETGGNYDGRLYGIFLVIIFGTSNTTMKFCLAYGNVGLHYLVQGQTYDSSSFTFKDFYNYSMFSNATLYVSYLASSAGEADYLYFNNHLLNSNAGDESTGWYFDLDSYNISTAYLTTSNNVTFDRGAESYLHPVLAILKATYKVGEDSGEDYIYYNFETPSEKEGFNWLYIEIPAICSIVIIVFYYQYKRKRQTTQLRT